MPNDQETILAAKATLDGKLEGIDITLKGRFRGDVKATGTVRIVEGSVVDAKVEANQVEIGGKFHGEVHTQALRLRGPARASGTFRAAKLSVEEGSLIDGEFEVGETALKPASEPSRLEQRR